MNLANAVTMFCVGGGAYIGLEFLWRGWSHISMFPAGGLCLLLVGHLNVVRPRLPVFFRILAGAGIITMVELAFGLVVNREYRVWDYRRQWGNFLGQVCPGYCLLWIPVSAAALLLHHGLQGMLAKKGRREAKKRQGVISRLRQD